MFANPSQPPVFRFAPSPNGALHLGHAYAALYNFEMAQRVGARFLLRIEDIDPVRSTEANIATMLEDLAWLGLEWEEPVLRQSTRFDAYRTAIASLKNRRLVYGCAATRKDIVTAKASIGGPAETDPDGAPRYRPICRSAIQAAPTLADQPWVCAHDNGVGPVAMRLDMCAAMLEIDQSGLKVTRFDADGRTTDATADPAIWGDAILMRKDTPASYHLASVIDDASQGVTHVVRGKDLDRATDLHRLLQDLLELPVPIYHHHDLVTDAAGRKLSKRDNDLALRTLRADGVTASEIRRRVGL